MATDNGLGELFREYGEHYITTYHPDLTRIKLIRSIRVCRTPALGGKVYTCKSCGHQKYVYYSCGNSRCPKCQGIKRLQWQDKLAMKLFNCPYQHMVFTLPHRLNRLSRDNPTAIFNLLLRSAWSSLKQCAMDGDHLGATPGAIMVLHTFGSDLKYHVHVHALVTFGGMDKADQWHWPKRKRKIVPFRKMRNTFRKHFMSQLGKIYETLQVREGFADIQSDLLSKSWCVHAEPPTTNSDRIKEYLGRYICRIGLSKNRFHYDKVDEQVSISFKDYRKKDKATGLSPMGHKKLQPLVAIHEILQHCLPAYFQKCRYYGLHGNACHKKYDEAVPERIKNNKKTVRTIFQIIKTMLGIETISCTECGHEHFDEQIITADSQWIYTFIWVHARGSPQNNTYDPFHKSRIHKRKILSMPRDNENH